MEVLKVEIEGITTSFRHPYFMIGRQPTFKMPPPSTIYGLISGVVGNFLDRKKLKFAYNFSSESSSYDLELLHIAVAGTGKIDNKFKHIQNLVVQTNPVPRQFLFKPKLTLYIDYNSDLEKLFAAFKEPYYAIGLGRSQDLVSFRKVEKLSLQVANEMYVEDTLLPWFFRNLIGVGETITLPRFINLEDRTKVEWSPYVLLQGKALVTEENLDDLPNYISSKLYPSKILVDPTTEKYKNKYRGLVWHSFSAEEGGNFDLGAIAY